MTVKDRQEPQPKGDKKGEEVDEMYEGLVRVAQFAGIVRLRGFRGEEGEVGETRQAGDAEFVGAKGDSGFGDSRRSEGMAEGAG